jgi:hypothetical protein
VAGDTGLVSIWPVDSLTKVFPDDTPGKNRTTEKIWLIPRNGHASIQIAVRSNTAIPAFSASLTLAGNLEAEVRRVGYVPVHANTPNTPRDELVHIAPGRFPDPLFEGRQFTIPASETTAIWIAIYAPAMAVPGTYTADVVLHAGQERVGHLQFKIKVVTATVPAAQTLKVSHWFYFDERFMAPYFDVQGRPDKLWELLGNIGRVMAAHKQNVFLTPVMSLTDAGWNGDRLEYDFSRLDRFIEVVSRTGAMQVIEGSHLIERAGGYDGPVKVPVFLADGRQVTRQQLDPDDPRAKTQLESFLSALYVHLKEKGWLHRYVQHVLDEPHGKEPAVYIRYAAIVRSSMPGVPTIDAFDQESGGWLGNACDIEVLQLGRFDNALDIVRPHVKAGGQAWYYTSLLPQGRYLNRFIDFPLIKTRLLPWLNYRYSLTGYLQWGGDSWGTNPFQITGLGFEVGAPTNGALPPGDAFITYPWREQNSIHSSIRLEAMGEGIEDYELLRILAVKNSNYAMRLAREAIPHFTDYVRDVSSFRRLQAELLTAVP